MLLTKKSEYALLALVSIANSKEPKNADILSSELNISKSFLAKVLQKLAKNDILNSYKGINGGFTLKKKSSEVTILDIIQIAEDKNPSVFECTANFGICTTGSGQGCNIFPILINLQNKINTFLDNLTLKDIL
jgi:Rrf2 family protein